VDSLLKRALAEAPADAPAAAAAAAAPPAKRAAARAAGRGSEFSAAMEDPDAETDDVELLQASALKKTGVKAKGSALGRDMKMTTSMDDSYSELFPDTCGRLSPHLVTTSCRHILSPTSCDQPLVTYTSCNHI